MPMLLEALGEVTLEEEDDTLHCMAAMVTSYAFVVLLRLAAAMPMLLEAVGEVPLEEEDDMLHCMPAMVTL